MILSKTAIYQKREGFLVSQCTHLGHFSEEHINHRVSFMTNVLIPLSAGQFFPGVLFHSLRLHALKVNYKNITLLVTKDLPRTFGWAQYISTTGTKVLVKF